MTQSSYTKLCNEDDPEDRRPGREVPELEVWERHECELGPMPAATPPTRSSVSTSVTGSASASSSASASAPAAASTSARGNRQDESEQVPLIAQAQNSGSNKVVQPTQLQQDHDPHAIDINTVILVIACLLLFATIITVWVDSETIHKGPPVFACFLLSMLCVLPVASGFLRMVIGCSGSGRKGGSDVEGNRRAGSEMSNADYITFMAFVLVMSIMAWATIMMGMLAWFPAGRYEVQAAQEILQANGTLITQG